MPWNSLGTHLSLLFLSQSSPLHRVAVKTKWRRRDPQTASWASWRDKNVINYINKATSNGWRQCKSFRELLVKIYKHDNENLSGIFFSFLFPVKGITSNGALNPCAVIKEFWHNRWAVNRKSDWPLQAGDRTSIPFLFFEMWFHPKPLQGILIHFRTH